MSESGAKIVFRGDAKHLVDQAKKGEKAVEGIGKAGASVSEQFGKMGGELGKAVARALALKAALKAAVGVIKEVHNEASQASRDVGKASVDRDLAAVRLGISAQDAAAITSGGVKSREEMTGFLGTLASNDDARQLGRQGVFRAAGLFGTGVFSQEEVLGAVKNRTLDALITQTGARFAALSPESARELQLRAAENTFAARAFDAKRNRGATERVADARYDALAAESPVLSAIAKQTGTDDLFRVMNAALDRQTDRLIQHDRPRAQLPREPQ